MPILQTYLQSYSHNISNKIVKCLVEQPENIITAPYRVLEDKTFWKRESNNDM